MGDGYARARARMLAHVARDASGASTSAVAPRAAWAGGATAAATEVGNGGGPATVATARTPAASPVKLRPNLNFLGNTMRAIASANARMDGKKRTREEESSTAAEAETLGRQRREREEHARKRRERDDRAEVKAVKRKKGGSTKRRGKKKKRAAVEVEREEGEWSDGD